ncbi:MAG: tetratricopeptide repeat protein [Spartobacteria bacterium]|nr:tetratricopeptide repeat protein [Spartobacteria bacterium]
MNGTKSQRAGWTWMLPGFFVLLLLGIRTVSGSQIWLHLAAGRSLFDGGLYGSYPLAGAALPDASWVNGTWLLDGLLFICWKMGGTLLLSLVKLVSVLGAYILLLPVVKKWAGAMSISLALMVCAWMTSTFYGLMPLLYVLWLPALFIRLLAGTDGEEHSWPKIALLAAFQVLWVNLHPSFVLGPVIVFLYLIQCYVSGAPRSRNQKTAMIRLATVLLATLVNPYFAGVYRPVVMLVVNPQSYCLTDQIAPFGGRAVFAWSRGMLYLSLMIAALGLLFQRDKLPLALTGLAVVGAFSALRMAFFAPACALLMFPFLCLSVQATGEAVRRFVEARWSGFSPSAMLSGVFTVLVLLSMWAVTTNAFYIRTGMLSSFGLGLSRGGYPSSGVISLIQGADFPPVYANDLYDGGYLSFFAPEKPALVTQQASVFPDPFYDRYVRALSGEQWPLFAKETGTGAVVLNMIYPYSLRMAQHFLSRGWAMAYFDGTSAIFMPRTPQNAAFLNDNDRRKSGLVLVDEAMDAYRIRRSSFIHPPIPARLVAAANLLMAQGQFDKAVAIYTQLVKGTPRLRMAWEYLGRCRLNMGEIELAVYALEQNVLLDASLAGSWLWLGRAYELAGRKSDADAAYDEARKRDTKKADEFIAAMQSHEKETNQ